MSDINLWASPPFIRYPLSCVYHIEHKNVTASDDARTYQTCHECNITFYAPDFYKQSFCGMLQLQPGICELK